MVARIRLTEGPILLSHVIAPVEDVACDLAVDLAWRPLADGRQLPIFRLHGEASEL